MEITILELHAYNKLMEEGAVPPILCPLDPEHMVTTPWVDEKERACQKCWACGTKKYLSQRQVDEIRLLLKV